MQFVKAASKKGLSASNWTKSVEDLIGGKAGGKGATSVGNGTNPEKVDEAVEAATKYLDRFHI